MRAFLLCLMFGLFSPGSLAVVETYEFSEESYQARYQDFIDELRCPKCQNQNLEGSNAPIAQDLRRELYRLIEDGRSDTEIVNFMVDRYGEFVLYRPRINAQTIILWLAPAIFLLVGIIILFMIYRRQRSRNDSEDSAGVLSPEEQQRLRDLLQDSENTEPKKKPSTSMISDTDEDKSRA